MKKISVIFMGTSDISVPLLKTLSDDGRFEIKLVVTQQDRHAGRKMELMPSPVKIISEKLFLPIFQPESINTEESMAELKKHQPDLILVMAYGQILKQGILDIPKECLNVHASLLPKYRGASPIQSSILNREKETGISLMKMVKKMDAGDVFIQFKIDIENNDNSEILTEKLKKLTSDNVPDALINVFNGDLSSEKQDETLITYVSKINKSDGNINWNEDAIIIDSKIKAFYGWPGTYTFFNGKRLKIIDAQLLDGDNSSEFGLVYKNENSILIYAKNGSIMPITVQIEGKNKQSINEFIQGNHDFIGTKLVSTS